VKKLSVGMKLFLFKALATKSYPLILQKMMSSWASLHVHC